MKITIEQRPMSGGRKSLRLVYYYGHEKDDTGKIKHHRKIENLDLCIYAKPTPAQKPHNKEVLRLAEAIK